MCKRAILQKASMADFAQSARGTNKEESSPPRDIREIFPNSYSRTHCKNIQLFSSTNV